MNAKAKGNRRERKTRDWLEAQGYMVTKAGGSLGLWDLIALDEVCVRLIQVKSNRTAPPLEREQMAACPAPPNATRELWIWHDGKRVPDVRRWRRGEWV